MAAAYLVSKGIGADEAIAALNAVELDQLRDVVSASMGVQINAGSVETRLDALAEARVLVELALGEVHHPLEVETGILGGVHDGEPRRVHVPRGGLHGEEDRVTVGELLGGAGSHGRVSVRWGVESG